MAAPLIELRGVQKLYGEGEALVAALDGVDLTIQEHEFVAVMGPSGSGKSTAMNILGCLDTPTHGQYLFRGVDVGSLSRDQRALLRRYYIGFVFQGYNLLRRTTAMANLELPLIYRGMPRSERRKRRWLRSNKWGSARAPTTPRRSSPGASSSALRLRARWSASLRWYSPTSPRAISIPA